MSSRQLRMPAARAARPQSGQERTTRARAARPAGVDTLTLDEVAVRSGAPLSLLRAAEQAGLLAGPLTADDVDAARAAMRFLDHGLPLPDLLDLARRHHAAMEDLVEAAVALFDDHVRHPLRDAGLPDEEAATQLVEAFDELLPALVAVVTHHFRRTLLTTAQAHLERVQTVT